MATNNQHCCVFVGNIPYDATEQQLKEICQEVGPVVNFRLVTDKDTKRPKGYGFCEYKDEETALSARRNLQGYEINGRQLRVDFAENDKNSDRSREQGRGGPGMAANPDFQKQPGAPSVHEPIGFQIAINAAAVMAGSLGGAQIPPNANDPLTLHLAKMSRNQLNDILSELKAMAIHNKESARQLLLARPQLSKALFQAEIMLGLVTPQVLQMPNMRQIPAQPPKPPISQIQNPISTSLQTSTIQPQVPIPQHNTIFNPPSNIQVRAAESSLPNSSNTRNKQILSSTSSLQDPRKVGPAALPSTSDARIARDVSSFNPNDQYHHPPKLMKLQDGTKAPHVGPASLKPAPVTEAQYFEKQTPQPQVPADVESVLLQQVMNLTPEQLSLLPPEQQQQVIQLQQMLRRQSS